MANLLDELHSTDKVPMYLYVRIIFSCNFARQQKIQPTEFSIFNCSEIF